MRFRLLPSIALLLALPGLADAAPVAGPQGRYCGTLYSAGRIVAAETTFDSANGDRITGEYQFRDGDAVTGGWLVEAGSQSDRKRLFIWARSIWHGAAAGDLLRRFRQFRRLLGRRDADPRACLDGRPVPGPEQLMRQTVCLMLIWFIGMAFPAKAEGYCRKLSYLGTDYTVCTADPRKSTIRLHDLDPHGQPYRTFDALAKALRSDGIFMRIAMNGGMYQKDLSPVGLYVENGVEKQKIDTHPGYGNFHLLPNGVFYLLAGSAGVMEAGAFAASGIRPVFATQSGPMLVINGKIHPKFDPASTSLKKRNGVGVDKAGQIVWAISEGDVRFHDFATLFRDVLGCDNALFLDGTISALYVPEWRRSDAAYPLGPILTVEISIPPG